MRAKEFSLTEAPMNPGEFGKAISTGHDKGVLVGFEFEVCVPEALKASPDDDETAVNNSGLDPRRKKFFEKEILPEIGDHLGMNFRRFDDTFKIKPGKSKFKNMQEAGLALEKNIKQKTKEIFYALVPARLQKKYIAAAKKLTRRKKWYADPELTFIRGLIRVAVAWKGLSNIAPSSPDFNHKKIGDAFDKIIDLGFPRENHDVGSPAAYPDWEAIIMYAFDLKSTQLTKFYKNFKDYFDFSYKKVWDLLDIDDMYDSDEGGVYDVLINNAVKQLLITTMGADVVIFNRYHEKKKNNTSWYIEPDASIEVPEDLQGEDQGIEIVSPPMPARDAIDALKKFYSLANQYKFYTNETTGLHINVSIPDKLDVLKLAIFLGDDYALAKFGRENNEYAEGVYQNLESSTSGKLPKDGIKGFENIMKKIVDEISSDHSASINWTGKYVSFRHAGGDYLNKYTDVYNIVGRFVRAMIIASDPTMYVKEYKKKLAKLVYSASEGQAGRTEEPKAAAIRQLYVNYKKGTVPIIRLYLGSKTKNNEMIFDALEVILGYDSAYHVSGEISSTVVEANSVKAQELITASLRAGAGATQGNNVTNKMKYFIAEIYPETAYAYYIINKSKITNKLVTTEMDFPVIAEKVLSSTSMNPANTTKIIQKLIAAYKAAMIPAPARVLRNLRRRR